MKITREMFIAATGRFPEQDDLERSNCPKAGQTFHTCCGWDWSRNKPRFEATGVVAHKPDVRTSEEP